MNNIALHMILAVVAPLAAQAPMEPAADLSVHKNKVEGLEVRFVDYHWQPALFQAMAEGSGEMPEARRDWVIASLFIHPGPLTLEGVRLPGARYALSLLPNKDGKGLGLEIRRIDMRDFYPDPNVMASAPPGETLYRGPAEFEIQTELSPRLDVAVGEVSKTIVLTVRYGDRRLALKLTR